jgi:hypothetical protein
MATYKGIKGVRVVSLAADPSPTVQNLGSVWYNTTSNALKYAIEGGGAWASAPAMNTARFGPGATGSTGTTTATLAYGGDVMPTEPRMVGNTELYNGTSWTELADLGTARGQSGGTGTTSAALCCGGEGPPPGFARLSSVELWNGASWSGAPANLGTARYALAAAGIQTATICYGGSTPGPTSVAINESWNGSAWTEVANLNTARSSFSGGGEFTNAMAVGTQTAGTTVEKWNGTSWTEIAALNLGRSNAEFTGNATLGLVMGGGTPLPTPLTATTESWNGTAWSEQNDMATARNNFARGGTTTATIIGGGYPNPGVAGSSEVWASPNVAIKTVTVS